MRKLTDAQKRAMDAIAANGSTGSADRVQIGTALNLRARGLVTMINHREGRGWTIVPFDGDVMRWDDDAETVEEIETAEEIETVDPAGRKPTTPFGDSPAVLVEKTARERERFNAARARLTAPNPVTVNPTHTFTGFRGAVEATATARGALFTVMHGDAVLSASVPSEVLGVLSDSLHGRFGTGSFHFEDVDGTTFHMTRYWGMNEMSIHMRREGRRVTALLRGDAVDTFIKWADAA